jgi:ABC-2 type transport system ATP-binding protein
MSELLVIRDLYKAFEDIVAVDGISLDVGSGEAFGLLGPNGAGKSTTMMMVSGVLEPDSGTIQVDGRSMSRRDRAARQILGVVPQELAIYPDLTAEENLHFFGSLYDLAGATLRKRVDEALERVGLQNRRRDIAETFSGGMKRRLNFAAAILHRPKLLILDEPTVGVDPQSRSHLLECVRDLQEEGTTVIYASHYMEEVEAICSRVAIVDHGRVLACDTLSSLLDRIAREVETNLGPCRLPADLNLPDYCVVESSGEETRIRLQSTAGASEASLNKHVSELLLKLAAHNIPVQSIRTHEPSLERLFLELTGTRLRD